MLKAQRVAILVDSENLEISVSENFEPERGLKNTHRAYPDWKEIFPEVVGQRTVIRNIYYKKKGLPISAKFRRFWTVELKGEIKQPPKSADPYIIVDAISLADKADVIVIMAGDKDYLPLIWHLRSKGCKVEMASFADAAAESIRQASDSFYTLDEKHTVVLESTS